MDKEEYWYWFKLIFCSDAWKLLALMVSNKSRAKTLSISKTIALRGTTIRYIKAIDSHDLESK